MGLNILRVKAALFSDGNRLLNNSVRYGFNCAQGEYNFCFKSL